MIANEIQQIRNRLKIRSLVFGLLFLISSLSTSCGNTNQYPQEIEKPVPIRLPDLSKQQWLSPGWNSPSDGYSVIEHNVNQQLTFSKNTTEILSDYARKADNAPTNPMRQFAYAYCLELASNRHISLSEGQLRRALTGLQSTDPTNSYEFSREHFIITVEYNYASEDTYNMRYILPLGRRLLLRNPTDWSLAWRIMLACYGLKECVAERLTLANEMLRQYPNMPLAHFSMAEADRLYALYITDPTKNRQYLQMSMNEYEAFLQVASSDDPHLPAANFEFLAMRDAMASDGQSINIHRSPG